MGKGRKREFDEQIALAAMSHVFWEKGYEGASYEDLVKGTGIQRYGLYNSFGDKRSAFTHCLNHYVDQIIKDFTAPLRSDNADISSIKNFFKTLLEAHIQPNPLGCFACNTVSENVAKNDKDINDAMERMYKLVLDSFKNALDNAHTKQQIPQDLDTQILANQLLGTMIGSSIMAKAPINKTVIKDFINSNLEKINATP